MNENSTTRRGFLLGAGGLALAGLAGCNTTAREAARPAVPADDPMYALMYGPKPDEQFPLPEIPYKRIPAQFRRQMVANPTGERPGIIVVDTANHFLTSLTRTVRPCGMASVLAVPVSNGPAAA